MEIIFLPKAQEHLLYWQNTNNKTVLKRIATLIRDITNDPFNGIGKPEPLKYELSGKWSRRIDKEHRIVYTVDGNTVTCVTCEEPQKRKLRKQPLPMPKTTTSHTAVLY